MGVYQDFRSAFLARNFSISGSIVTSVPFGTISMESGLGDRRSPAPLMRSTVAIVPPTLRAINAAGPATTERAHSVEFRRASVRSYKSQV